MTTLKQTRKSVKPVHGTCRWLRPIGELDRLSGLLQIGASFYGVVLIPGGVELYKGGSGGTTYHVCTSDPHGWTCDCPDAEFRSRPGGCKHVAALRAALAAIGVSPLPAAPTIPAACPAELENL